MPPKTTPEDLEFGDTPPDKDKTTPPSQTNAQQAQELERLRKELAELKAQKTEAFVFGGDPNESPAGTAKDDEGNEIDLYWYRVELPPSGGTDIRLSGAVYYHGQTYKVDVHQLRSLKDIVARTWGHENTIRGNNENFYRKETATTLRGGERGRR